MLEISPQLRSEVEARIQREQNPLSFSQEHPNYDNPFMFSNSISTQRDLSHDVESLDLSSESSVRYPSNVCSSIANTVSAFKVNDEPPQAGGITLGKPPAHSNIPQLTHSNIPHSALSSNNQYLPPVPTFGSSITKGINNIYAQSHFHPHNSTLPLTTPVSSFVYSASSFSSPFTSSSLSQPSPSSYTSQPFTYNQESSQRFARETFSVPSSSANNKLNISSNNGSSNCSAHLPRKRLRKTGLGLVTVGLATVDENNWLDSTVSSDHNTVGKYRKIIIFSLY